MSIQRIALLATLSLAVLAGCSSANQMPQATAGGHPSGYDDPAVHGPDAIANIGSCTACHGATYDGGNGPSCNACHATTHTTKFPAGVADWKANCTFCHGTATEPYPAIANPVLAAPPEGVAGQTLATDLHVGAHQTHLHGRATSAITRGVACASCHAVPADLSHLDGTAAVVTVTPGTTTATGSFDPVAGSCASTYCHGNFRNGKANVVPSWTATSGFTACDACHQPQSSVATATDDHWNHVNPAGPRAMACSSCHGAGYGSTSITGTALGTHANGTIEIQSLFGYNPTAHTCSSGCHGAAGHVWY